MSERLVKTAGEIVAESLNTLKEEEALSSTVKQASSWDDDTKQFASIHLREQVLHSVPTTAEELWNCVKVLFGIEIPWTSTDPRFNSPFEWFYNLFFRKVAFSLAIASRGGSKTFNAAILNYLNGHFYPNHQSVHAASTKVQADVMASYLRDFNNDEVLHKTFDRKQVNKGSVGFNNKSFWKIVAGNQKSISGQHVPTLTLDEIEFWDIQGIIQSLRVPLDDRYGHKKMWAGFSTRQRSFGGMSMITEQAEKRGIKVFQWSAFETMERCKTCIALDKEPHGTEEARNKVCNLWEDCRGIRGTKASGWVSLEDVQEFKRTLGGNSDAWKTQGLCEKPSSHGLVLHNFNHEMKPNGNYTEWEYRPELPYYITHDPAESKKSCILFIQIYEGALYVFDELIQDPCSDTTESKEALYAHIVEAGYGVPTSLVVDPRRPDAEAVWKRGSLAGEGLNFKFNALCPPIDDDHGGSKIFMGIEYMRSQIRAGDGSMQLFINPNKCPGLVLAVKEYHYKMGPNNEILDTGNPDKAYSDEIDALRYFVQYYQFVIRKGKPNYRVHWVNG